MLKPHICSVISGNKKMQFEMEFLLKTMEAIGGCRDYYCTIFSNDNIDSRFLQNRAEIKTYKVDERLTYPWWTCPRWHAEEKGDFLLMLDSDIVVLNNVEQFFQDAAAEKMSGVIAFASPFPNSFQQWCDLFEKCRIPLPKYWNTYRSFNELEFPHNLFAPQKDSLCPYYINHGVIALPLKFQKIMNETTQTVIEIIHKTLQNNYWFPQIITALAVELGGIPTQVWPTKYNCLRPLVENGKTYRNVVNDETVFYHYSSSREKNYQNVHEFMKDHPTLKLPKSITGEGVLL